MSVGGRDCLTSDGEADGKERRWLGEGGATSIAPNATHLGLIPACCCPSCHDVRQRAKSHVSAGKEPTLSSITLINTESGGGLWHVGGLRKELENGSLTDRHRQTTVVQPKLPDDGRRGNVLLAAREQRRRIREPIRSRCCFEPMNLS